MSDLENTLKYIFPMQNDIFLHDTNVTVISASPESLEHLL